MNVLVLDATTQTIEAVLAGSVAANQPEFTSHYADVTTTALTEGSDNGTLNDTTDVNVVAAPGSSTRRVVKEISIYNKDTASVNLTVKFNDNGTERIIWKNDLAAGQTWTLSEFLNATTYSKHATSHTDGTDDIQDAAADGSTKGIATFDSDNFSASSGVVSIKSGGVDLADEVTGILPEANGGTGLDTSGVTDGQLLVGNSSDNTFDLATLTGGTGLSVVNGNGSITINGDDAAADDSTKGVATFEADDFDSASGKIDLAVSVTKASTTDSGTATPTAHDLNIVGGEGIDTSGANAIVTIAGEDASATNKGIASFDAASFSNSSGDIRSANRKAAITVESPGAAEDISIFFTNVAITVTEMRAVLIGSDTPSVTWTVRHYATDRSNAGNEVVTGGTTTTSTSTGSDVTSFNDATIPADSYVWLETTAQSGTVTELHVTIVYNVDAT